MTVVDANITLLAQVNQTIEHLTELWNQVSMDQKTREQRTQTAYQLFYNAMREVVSNEEEMVQGVFEDIKRDLIDVAATRHELGLAPFPDGRFPENSIALVKLNFPIIPNYCLFSCELLPRKGNHSRNARSKQWQSKLKSLPNL
jgi:hypothetical protein